jgi:hypothetical protein
VEPRTGVAVDEANDVVEEFNDRVDNDSRLRASAPTAAPLLLLLLPAFGPINPVFPMLLLVPLLSMPDPLAPPDSEDDNELDANADDVFESPMASRKCFNLGMHPRIVLRVESVK